MSKQLSVRDIFTDHIFDDLVRSVHKSSQESSFPPYNIWKNDSGDYGLEIAVAGFSTDEIDIEYDGMILAVHGKKSGKQENVQYVTHGIASREFQRNFTVRGSFELSEATLYNGILSIRLTASNTKKNKIPIIQK